MTKELVPTTPLLQEWSQDQFGEMNAAIAKHFRYREIKTRHGNYPKGMGIKKLEEILGLPYTSSSSCAAYWVTNTDVDSNDFEGYRYVGFAISKGGKFCAILWDKDENEKLIEL